MTVFDRLRAVCCSLLFALGVLGLTTTAWAEPAAPAKPQKPAAQRPAQPKAGPSKPASGDGPRTKTGEPPKAPDSDATKGDAASPGKADKPKSKSATGGSNFDPFTGSSTDQRQSDIYGDRLDGLQTDVDALKDKIFRSKARLSLLKETVLRGVLAGSRVILAHRNLMGAGFKLVRIVYIMDGAQIYARTDETGSLDSEDELVIYDGNLPPGPHNVTIELTYKGHGYGVFSYLSQYTFESRSSHSFTAPENGAIKITSAGFEDGNVTTQMRDRPNVQWQELELDASGRPLPKTSRRSGSTKRRAKK